jgi:hypothetical protein
LAGFVVGDEFELRTMWAPSPYLNLISNFGYFLLFLDKIKFGGYLGDAGVGSPPPTSGSFAEGPKEQIRCHS